MMSLKNPSRCAPKQPSTAWDLRPTLLGLQPSSEPLYMHDAQRTSEDPNDVMYSIYS